jgi:hypothetical protein
MVLGIRPGATLVDIPLVVIPLLPVPLVLGWMAGVVLL